MAEPTEAPDPGVGGVGGAMPGTGGAAPGTGGASSVGGATGGASTATGGSAGTAPGAGGVGTGGVGGSAGVGTGGVGVGGSAGLATGGVGVGGSAGVTATGGAGGLATGGTAGASAAGTGGSAGTASSGTPCPAGCAQLTVPFTAYRSGQFFEIYLSADLDLSAAVINVRARKISGKAGGMVIVVKNGSAQSYAYAQSMWNSINTMTTEFSNYTLDVAMPSSTDMNNTFVPAAVRIISIQVAAGDPWYTDTAMTIEDPTALVNPTVVQLDDITITGTGTYPGPYAFAAATDVTLLQANLSAAALAAMPPYAVTGSTVTWVGP